MNFSGKEGKRHETYFRDLETILYEQNYSEPQLGAEVKQQSSFTVQTGDSYCVSGWSRLTCIFLINQLGCNYRLSSCQRVRLVCVGESADSVIPAVWTYMWTIYTQKWRKYLHNCNFFCFSIIFFSTHADSHSCLLFARIQQQMVIHCEL